jgi:hypothetical protein
MRIEDFELERYFARYEFTVRHLLCASDVEGWHMSELLALADGETAALWQDLRLGYTEPSGHPGLLAEISSLYDTIAPDEVLVFNGAEEAIFTAANVLLGPGDHAIVTWPAYQSLHAIARATGADVTLHELRASEAWAIDLELLRRQVTPRTKLIVVNVPHNPTGALPDIASYRAIADIAADAGATLLSDEVYRFLELEPLDRLPAGADVGPHGVSVGVMSKSFAMAGVRIGWLATHDRRFLDGAARFKDYTTICASAPAEILSIVAGRRPGAVAVDHRGQPRDRGRVLRAAVVAVRLGPPAGRLDRLPGAACRRAHRPLRRGPRAGGGRPARAGVDLRPPREPLPARVRAHEPAGRHGAPRGVRGPGAGLTRQGDHRRRGSPGTVEAVRSRTRCRCAPGAGTTGTLEALPPALGRRVPRVHAPPAPTPIGAP